MRRLDEGRITLHLDSLAATERLAARLAAVLRPGDALLLEGPLGAGKSALARAVLRACPATRRWRCPRPSFTLVQSYDLPRGRRGAPFRPVPPVRPRRPRGTGLGRGAGRASCWWNGRTASARCGRTTPSTSRSRPAPGRRSGWPRCPARPERLAGLAGMRFPEPFLAAHGYGAAERAPLPADASLRRYTRLRGGPRPALLMDAPPPEDVRPFAALARHLLAAGLSVPEILAEDAAAGLPSDRGFRRRDPCRPARCRRRSRAALRGGCGSAGRAARRAAAARPAALGRGGDGARDRGDLPRLVVARRLRRGALARHPRRAGRGARARSWRPSPRRAASSTATSSRPT